MLQRAAVLLRDQFRNVVFLHDRNLRDIRFEVVNDSNSAEAVAIKGLLEYEQTLDGALETIRKSYDFQLRPADRLDPNSKVIEAAISPFAKPHGWDEQDDMPHTFELELRYVEPRTTIPFPAIGVDTIGDSEIQEVVFLIHGIRDRAGWQSRVQRVLEEVPTIKVIPIKFGFLDVVRFWFPFWTRTPSIEFTRGQIQIGKNRHKADHYSVIAHSFGTYAITKILTDTKDLVLHRLVLCGCVVQERFPWENISARITTDVINDHGTRDIWPVMAKKLSWGYGETGRHGFGRADVVDRAHNFKHSDFFQESFIRDYWRPWFDSGKYVKSRWAEDAPISPWLLDVFSALPVKLIITTTAMAMAFSAYWFWPQICAFAFTYWTRIALAAAVLLFLVCIVAVRMFRRK